MIADNQFGGYTLMAIEQAVMVDIFNRIQHNNQQQISVVRYSWDDFKKFCVHAFPEANLIKELQNWPNLVRPYGNLGTLKALVIAV